MDQKGSHISGGLATTEFLESSRSVLQGHRSCTATKGAQQFFTPDAVAAFVARCLSDDPANDPRAVWDPTGAGSGALLRPWAHRYGCEIDKDYEHCQYRCIRGDYQKINPMAVALGLKAPVIVANPPFGLMHKYNGHEGRSARIAWHMVTDLIDTVGKGAMIVPRSDYLAIVDKANGGDYIKAVISIPDMFGSKVEVDCVVFIFTGRRAYYPQPIKQYTVTAGKLEDSNVPDEIYSLIGDDSWRWNNGSQLDFFNKRFDALRAEFKEREANQGEQNSCLTFAGKKIRIRLSPYEVLRLTNEGKKDLMRRVTKLNGQSAYKLGQDLSEWEDLQVLVTDGDLHISDDVKAKFEDIKREVEYIYAPMLTSNALHDRLAALRNCREIKCIKSDPDKGFHAGDTYPVRVQTIDWYEKGVRPAKKKQKDRETGDIIEVWVNEAFENEGKAMKAFIGDQEFVMGRGEDMSDGLYLEEHFDLPMQPGLAELDPEGYKAMRAQVIDTVDRHDLDDPFAELA